MVVIVVCNDSIELTLGARCKSVCCKKLPADCRLISNREFSRDINNAAAAESIR